MGAKRVAGRLSVPELVFHLFSDCMGLGVDLVGDAIATVYVLLLGLEGFEKVEVALDRHLVLSGQQFAKTTFFTFVPNDVILGH